MGKVKSWGIPFMGSKNKIAKDIINILPKARILVDLFGGGAAITECASVSGKWDRIIYNEINPLTYKAVVMAANGEFDNENRWISHDEFMKLRYTDCYAAICFSFATNMQDYCYSKQLEPIKKQLHETNGRCESKERLHRLQSYERLSRLKDFSAVNVDFYNLDYRDVEIPLDSVIYCDIPYKNTRKYNKTTFDESAFIDWCLKMKNKGYKNIYVSSYDLPNDIFECVWQKQRTSMVDYTTRTKVTEKLYKVK